MCFYLKKGGAGMHTEKYKAKNLGLLDEASRDKYVNKETEQYDCTSHSKIDFERTHYNVNLCPHDEYSHEYVKDLNKLWRGQSKSLRKLEDDDNIFFMTVLTLPKDFLPELEGLEGKELTEYIMSHEDVKEQVEDFFETGYETLKEIYHLDDLDVISAYVHYDEETPHLHFTAIPHVHAQEEEKEADPETLRLYELSSTDPIRYCEEQKKTYQEKAEKTKENIDKAYAKGDIKRAEKLKKSYEKRLSDIAKLDKADPIKYAAKHRSKYKSQISAQKGKRETVSYEKVVPLSVYNNQHNIMQDILSKHFGRHIGILNGKTLGFDVQKLTAEEKEKLLQAAKELEQMEAEKHATEIGNDFAQYQRELINADIAEAKTEKRDIDLENALSKNELNKINADIETKTALDQQITENIEKLTHPEIIKNLADPEKYQATLSLLCQKSAKYDQMKREHGFYKGIVDKQKDYDKYKEIAEAVSETYEDVEKAFKDPTLTNAELSTIIKHYALTLSDDKEKEAILSTCEALDKIDAYSNKSYKQRARVLKREAESGEKLIDLGFDFADYDSRIRGMLKKSLTYEGRTDIYKGKDNLKSLWADIQTNNRNFWEKKKEKNKTAYEGYISLDKVFTTVIPRLIQSAVQAIKTYIDFIKQAQREEHER